MSEVFNRPGRHHAVWKEWRRIARGKERRFFLEHRQAVLESLQGAWPPAQVLLSTELYGQDPDHWLKLVQQSPGVSWFLIAGKQLDDVASVPTNSGLCGVFDPRPGSLASVLEARFLLVTWQLCDPGNLGTLIRVCRALGEGALLVVGGCNPWSAKVARSSAGSLLKANLCWIPAVEGGELLPRLKNSGFSVFGACPRAGQRIDQLVWGEKCAVMLGNETVGLPDDLPEWVQTYAIPMQSEVESLNAAVAGAITVWEWRRTASPKSSRPTSRPEPGSRQSPQRG